MPLKLFKTNGVFITKVLTSRRESSEKVIESREPNQTESSKRKKEDVKDPKVIRFVRELNLV